MFNAMELVHILKKKIKKTKKTPVVYAEYDHLEALNAYIQKLADEIRVVKETNTTYKEMLLCLLNEYKYSVTEVTEQVSTFISAINKKFKLEGKRNSHALQLTMAGMIERLEAELQPLTEKITQLEHRLDSAEKKVNQSSEQLEVEFNARLVNMDSKAKALAQVLIEARKEALETVEKAKNELSSVSQIINQQRDLFLYLANKEKESIKKSALNFKEKYDDLDYRVKAVEQLSI